MATNIKPLHDRVIIRRIEDNVNQTAGGLFIPDTAKEKPQEGEVIAAGEGKYKEDGTRQTLDVKAGDRVLFGKYSGSEIKLDGEEFIIMREDEILGIIEPRRSKQRNSRASSAVQQVRDQHSLTAYSFEHLNSQLFNEGE